MNHKDAAELQSIFEAYMGGKINRRKCTKLIEKFCKKRNIPESSIDRDEEGNAVGVFLGETRTLH
jgi:hypothetical protein